MRRALTSIVVLGLAGVLAASGQSAIATPPEEIDQSLLVPTTLDSSFAPFDCRMAPTGPICTGERHLREDWAAWDFPCTVPVYGSRVEDRYATRYYDHGYLNYDRRIRSDETDFLSTSATGPATGTIHGHFTFFEPFAVPGDDTTFTVITRGTIWEIRPVDGPALLRVVGTLVEPPAGTATFTGHATIDGVTTTYEGAPLGSFFSDELFLSSVCEAATGDPTLVW